MRRAAYALVGALAVIGALVVAPAGTKTYSIEKIRFLKPDVAVVQVRPLSTGGNLGTYVMSKESGKWLTVSFTNVGYQLRPSR